jgi:hypothetical protein
MSHLASPSAMSLRGEVAEKAERGGRFLAGEQITLGEVGDQLFSPIVSPTVLLITMVLAVFKPWGANSKSASCTCKQ